jgi:hypothetical protein
MEDIDQLLSSLGLPVNDLYSLPDSQKRFPDGAHYRIEIPSTEGPACLEAVLDEALKLNVPIHRISQGSGVFMLTDNELDQMAKIAKDAKVEVSLFVRPNAGWTQSAMTRASAGSVASATAWGQDQVKYCIDDILRAAQHGIRSVLIADIGVLYVFGKMRENGIIPKEMQAKVSVMLGISNPVTSKLVQDLGANTVNVSTDLGLAQLAAIRHAIDIPLDIYVEVPDNLGGFVRIPEVPEIIRICSPVYIKFGLRNAPDIYPSGKHLESVAVAMSRERVRRAKLALELLERNANDKFVMSQLGAKGIALPAV